MNKRPRAKPKPSDQPRGRSGRRIDDPDTIEMLKPASDPPSPPKPKRKATSPRKAGSKTRKKARRPVRYSEELGERICMRVAMGETLHAISLDPDMPHNTTMREWRAKHAEFGDNYAREGGEGGRSIRPD